MPKFSTEVPHSLGQEQAAEKLKNFLPTIEQRFAGQISDLQGDWQDPHTLTYSFTSFGIKLAGTLQVLPESVAVSGDIPFSAMIFKGKIVAAIQKALEKVLASD